MSRLSESPLGVAVMSIVLSVVIPAVAVGGLSSCAGPRPRLGPVVAAADGRTLDATIALVGDSLTVGEFTTLPAGAAERGLRLDISAQIGRQIPEGVDELRRLAGRDLVVALGTNDARVGLTGEAADALIDQTLDVAGAATPVMWLTVYRGPASPEGPAVEVFNAALARAVPRHPNLVLADWAGVVRSQPALLAADQVHLTEAGYATRSRWLVHHMASLLAPG